MSDRELLLRAVLTDPAEHTPRLVYADFLQEQGEHDRAEFIRLQCELAKHPECRAEPPCVLVNCDQPEHLQGWCSACAPVALRRAREWDFVRAKNCCWEWAAGSSGDYGWTIDNRTRAVTRNSLSDSPVKSCFARGFVSRVEMPCAAFLAVAADLFAAHPVTSVRLTDREPSNLGYGWGWYCEPIGAGPSFIPAELWHEASGADDDTRWVRADPQDCVRAMGLRCVAYGRSRAGLPRCPNPCEVPREGGPEPKE